MSHTQPCQVCRAATDDACERCRQPTCDEHFFDQEFLGVCEPCREELDRLIEQHGALTIWPHPIRKAKPGWLDPNGPKVPTRHG